MARFHGVIGFGFSEETPSGSGIFEDRIEERSYTGDITRSARTNGNTPKILGDVLIDNSISIVADEGYTLVNLLAIRYVKVAGVRWTVSNIEVNHPRLTLRLGEVYNGPTP
jgi:hypothetical protein